MASRPQPKVAAKYSSGDYSDDDETSVEEEVIVVYDEGYTDHTREEILAEFELSPEKTAPTRPKNAFDMYNDQLKASMAQPKQKKEEPVETGWRGKMKKRLSWKASKPKDKSAAAPATISEEFAVEPEKPKSTTSFASAESAGTNGTTGTTEHIKKGAAGWWGISKADSQSESSDIEESTEFGPMDDKMEPAKDTVDSLEPVAEEKPPPPPPMETDDAVPSVKSPTNKRKSVVLSRYPPATMTIEDPDEPSAEQPPLAKGSPVVMPQWLKKDGLPSAPGLQEEEGGSTKPKVQKPVVRGKVVLPKWLQPADPAELEEAKRQAELRKAAAKTRKWKKPEAKAIPPPVNSSRSHESDTTPIPAGTTTKVVGKLTQEHESSETETDSMPPKPISPRPAKGSLVNRYLSSVVKTDPTAEERMAQIEADRARGRWDGKAYVRSDGGDGSGTKQRKNWKFLQEKEKKTPIDEGPVIKIQAIARGYLARKRVAQLVDSMIAELMRSLDNARAEEEARYKENQLLMEEEEFKRWQEREAERRKNEEEAIKKKMYDERYGLPLWWMEMIPHKTMNQKEYDRAMKKDKGFTVVDYKLPPRSKKTLDAVTEEENEVDDENDANPDKIIVNDKKTKKKGLFSWMGKKQSAPDTTTDTNKEDEIDGENVDKEETPTEPDQPQESAPPEAKKIWM